MLNVVTCEIICFFATAWIPDLCIILVFIVFLTLIYPTLMSQQCNPFLMHRDECEFEFEFFFLTETLEIPGQLEYFFFPILHVR